MPLSDTAPVGSGRSEWGAEPSCHSLIQHQVAQGVASGGEFVLGCGWAGMVCAMSSSKRSSGTKGTRRRAAATRTSLSIHTSSNSEMILFRPGGHLDFQFAR